MTATTETNGSPSWKMIAVGLVSLATLLVGAMAANALDDIAKANAANVRQDRELTEVSTNVSNMRADLARIEALLTRLDYNLRQTKER